MKIALAAAFALCACAYPVDRADCAIDSDCGSGAFCLAGSCRQGSRTCPTLQPRYASIDRDLFQVSCGTSGNKAFNCHSTEGAASASFLDLSGDAYPRLVGRTAVNPLGDRKDLVLVKPGDPQNSFLVQKLRLTTALDPHLGSGMPADAPGSICPSSVDAVAQWILAGAGRN
ncbi:MAG TPA: hypothetical protein VEQ15_14175 [Myxococcales bacterium]|nr:hypothetical protein [Myxococcales bacterium]